MRLLAFLASGMLLGSHAWAFHVTDHLQITQRAVMELSSCGLLPTAWTADWTTAVRRADEDEDLDLLRKWIRYSHYYNPNHPLHQFRADSSASVSESVTSILADPQDVVKVNWLLGRIIHHVQDASVPSHVVPVAHWMSDGFERFDDSDYFAGAIGPEACERQAAGAPMDVLRANALATLASLNDPVTIATNGEATVTTWLGTFWSLGKGNNFGAYGSLGDVFGKAQISEEESGYGLATPVSSVTMDQYRAFKRARLAAAVRATEAVILWANQVRVYRP